MASAELPATPPAADGGWFSAAQWPEAVEHLRLLTAAGMPLPSSLRDAAEQTGAGRLRTELGTLADRVEQGQPLDEAIDGLRLPLAEPLRTVLAAGVQTGDLYSVLAPLAAAARVSEELVREYRRALIYALFCFLFAVMLVAMIVGVLWPNVDVLLQQIDGPAASRPPSLVPRAAWPMLAVPVVLAALVVVDRIRRIGHPERLPLEWLPPISGTASRIAWFRWAAVLQSLVRHRVPLPDAVRMAGRSTASPPVRRDSDAMAAAIEKGRPLSEAVASMSTMPLMLRLLILPEADPEVASAGEPLAVRLEHATTILAESLRARLSRVQRQLEVIATISLALGLLGYSLLVIGPFRGVITVLERAGH